MDNNITSSLIPTEQRLAFIEKIFGIAFPIQIEPLIYFIADRLSCDYNGGYWHCHSLSNNGFHMHPESVEPFHVIADNEYEGDLQPETFGIVCCLYAFSHLSFSEQENLSRLSADHYHRLREYSLDRPDAGEILRATD